MQQRDKSDLPLPSLSYKYFLLQYSSSILSFYSLIPTFSGSGTAQELQELRSRISSDNLLGLRVFFLSERKWPTTSSPLRLTQSPPFSFILLLYSYSSANLFTEYSFSSLFPFPFLQPSNLSGVG